MAVSHSELARPISNYQSHFRLLFRKMRQKHSGMSDGIFKARRNDGPLPVLLGFKLFSECKFRFPDFRYLRIEHDGDLSVVLGGKFANDQAARSRCCLPVYAAKIVIRLVIT